MFSGMWILEGENANNLNIFLVKPTTFSSSVNQPTGSQPKRPR